MTENNDIIRNENLTTAQKNAALAENGVTAYSLDDNANVITEAEAQATKAGETAQEVNGWGYLFTGGIKAKVHVVNGVIQGGCGGNPEEKDYVEIGGKKYALDGDKLVCITACMTKMEIQRAYWLDEISLYEANKGLERYNTSIPEHLVLSGAERAATTVGDTPESVTGIGLMQTGAGWPEKVYIENGKFEKDTGFTAENKLELWIGGKAFIVDGDHII